MILNKKNVGCGCIFLGRKFWVGIKNFHDRIININGYRKVKHISFLLYMPHIILVMYMPPI